MLLLYLFSRGHGVRKRGGTRYHLNPPYQQQRRWSRGGRGASRGGRGISGGRGYVQGTRGQQDGGPTGNINLATT